MEVNLADGSMRVTNDVIGKDIQHDLIDSASKWPTEAIDQSKGDIWIPYSIVEYRLINGTTHKKRIGMVYVDAFSMALALSRGKQSELMDRMNEIRNAGSKQIWEIRARFRSEFEKSLLHINK